MHEHVVEVVERFRNPVRLLAQLIGEGDDLLEVDVAVAELRAQLADELSEQADGVAETFNSLNDTLMQSLDKVKSGRSRGSNRDTDAKSESKAATRS